MKADDDCRTSSSPFGKAGKSSRGTKDEIVDHVASMRRYAMLLVGNANDADDIVQEALSRVLAKSSLWSEIKDLRAYLFTTLHNVHVDHIRRSSRFSDSVPIEDAIASLATPARQVKNLELRDLVQGLARLPVEQRQVVLLVGFEGMSYLQTAKTLSIPIGTVMSRLSRGRDTLRRLTERGPVAKLRVVK